LRAVDRRLVVLLALVAFWSCAVLLRDRGIATRLGLHAVAWLPLPILPAVLAAVALLATFASGAADLYPRLHTA